MKNTLLNFKIEGEILSCERYGNGHINVTYLVVTTKRRYILQKINNYVFKDVDILMNNIELVTSYLRSINTETLDIVRTLDDKTYYHDESGYYRVYLFVENSLCLEKATDLDLVYRAGKSFGAYHKSLAKMDASKLKETIPHFHDTRKRYNDFLKAKKENKLNRLNTCLNEVKTVEKYQELYGLFVDSIADHSIALAVTHNDPKINNVLFDNDTKQMRCIIDLDTVMPGSVLYDFGDALRSLFTGENEDSKDLSLLKVNYDIFRSYLQGYYSETRGVLNNKEIEYLSLAPFMLTIECGMRFLADYLEGDVYFHTKYPEHNLVRARTQLTLAEDILNNQEKLKEIVREITK